MARQRPAPWTNLDQPVPALRRYRIRNPFDDRGIVQEMLTETLTARRSA
jgi:hypothetical protein